MMKTVFMYKVQVEQPVLRSRAKLICEHVNSLLSHATSALWIFAVENHIVWTYVGIRIRINFTLHRF